MRAAHSSAEGTNGWPAATRSTGAAAAAAAAAARFALGGIWGEIYKGLRYRTPLAALVEANAAKSTIIEATDVRLEPKRAAAAEAAKPTANNSVRCNAKCKNRKEKSYA
jgi:hypothetical protein